MDHTKLMTILCAFLLLVCLVLSIIALTVMRNAVEESRGLREKTHLLLNALEDSVEAMAALDRETQTEEAPLPPTSDKEETPFFDGLIVRIENGHVGVYTKGGELLRVLDIDPSALPKKDRDLLEAGIEIGSWKELLALIQDYVG